ncbi:hypothetical protein JOC54_004124 [Alkalihalobacillus xiaoxiensis]|uniref:Uncharacterized protein YyaB-like PH domain-containing protein n=1 Tax=Shouchella xiaoxiensis TaxID=766895 RepID=A0ABS2SZ83_9BACI|nr:PH domain-containing protein [Shouchella xiaoxiensis]MBM7840831.1 hypothetical protein [Shouchella xiaoxiensis]
MVFRSKVDLFFVSLLSSGLLLLSVPTILPTIIGNPPLGAIIVLLASFIFCGLFILWIPFTITYTISDSHLIVKGGPFKSTIPINKITKISATSNIFSGHRILSSRDALEVFNKTTFSGSVKISPKNKHSFLHELQQRFPEIEVDSKIVREKP